MAPTFRIPALAKLPAVSLDGTTELLTVAIGSSIGIELEANVADIKALAPANLLVSSASVTCTIASKAGKVARLTITGVSAGAAEITTSLDGSPRLVVTAGEHVSHLGAGATDLLAAASNGTNARTIVAIQQILHNNSASIVDQLTGPYGSQDALACGDVCAATGKALFSSTSTAYNSYHKPISTKGLTRLAWDDIQYAPTTMAKAIRAIEDKLKAATAVRLGMTYSPAPGMVAANGAIQPDRSGGHFVLVVGMFPGGKFLYLDPYPGGSVTTYAGGLPFNQAKTCTYLGILERKTHPTRGLHLKAVGSGSLSGMEAIAGPF